MIAWKIITIILGFLISILGFAYWLDVHENEDSCGIRKGDKWAVLLMAAGFCMTLATVFY